MAGPSTIRLATGRENRLLPRPAVSFPARLELPGGVRSAQILDLHARGARLEMSSPPGVGAAALLKWATSECFCTVVWAEGSECGLAFEFEASLVIDGDFNPAAPAHLGAVAAFDKIQLGVKRTPKL